MQSSSPPPSIPRRNWLRARLPRLLMIIFVPVLVISAIVGVWYITRAQPAPIVRELLFPGIWYTRDIRQAPVAQIIHIIDIDLKTPGMHFRVTPKDDRSDYVYSARTVSQFLVEQGLSFAMNGDYFGPSHDTYILDYYPHVGDGIDVRGYTVSDGQEVSIGYDPVDNDYPSLYLGADNTASFEPLDNPYNVLSGNLSLVTEGKTTPSLYERPVYQQRQPRSAVALTQDNSRLLLVVVDGRQPNYSDGASLLELADIVIQYGGYTAMNIDGGGSSTMVIRDDQGDPFVLNSPIHNRIPGRQRPVANHLGIWYDLH